MNFILKTFSIIFLVTLLISCKKKNNEVGINYSGTYSCNVKKTNWQLNTGIIDTFYQETVIVEQYDNTVFLLSKSYPVDSLQNSRRYTISNGSNYTTVQFNNDSLYFYSSAGGLGGGVLHEYKGIKVK